MFFKRRFVEKGIYSFQKLTTYFIRKGNRSKIESQVRSFLSKKKKRDARNMKVFFMRKESKVKKQHLLFQSEISMKSVMPYIRLLVRKRGKRLKYKIGFLEKQKAEKKAYLSVAKSLRETKNDYFLSLLQKEVEKISSKKSALIVKRNQMHKTAKIFAPQRWFSKWRKQRWLLRKQKKKKKQKLVAVGEKFAEELVKKRKQKEFYKILRPSSRPTVGRLLLKRKVRKCLKKKDFLIRKQQMLQRQKKKEENLKAWEVFVQKMLKKKEQNKKSL